MRLLLPKKPSFSRQMVHLGYPPFVLLPLAAFFGSLNSGLARLIVTINPFSAVKRGLASNFSFFT